MKMKAMFMTATMSLGLSAWAGPVELTGIIETGLSAIGGETTGVVLHTERGHVELQLNQDSDVQSLNGKVAKVKGQESVVIGVETGPRRVVKVDSVQLPQLETFTGELKDGIFAIGGETTGFVLAMPGQWLELLLSEELQERARTEFSGKLVEVRGLRTQFYGVEIPVREGIIVEDVTIK